MRGTNMKIDKVKLISQELLCFTTPPFFNFYRRLNLLNKFVNCLNVTRTSHFAPTEFTHFTALSQQRLIISVHSWISLPQSNFSWTVSYEIVTELIYLTFIFQSTVQCIPTLYRVTQKYVYTLYSSISLEQI